MSGQRRQDEARARLAARLGRKPDADLIDDTIKGVRDSVAQREPIDEVDAQGLAAQELRRMRDERRSRSLLANRK